MRLKLSCREKTTTTHTHSKSKLENGITSNNNNNNSNNNNNNNKQPEKNYLVINILPYCKVSAKQEKTYAVKHPLERGCGENKNASRL